METIKVLICDDHYFYRTGIRTWLETKEKIDVIGECEDGLKLLKYLKHAQPDLILLDINMPVMDGAAALVEVKKQYPAIKVVMLSMNDTKQMIAEMMKLGADGYLTKNDDTEEIYKAIVECHEKGRYLNERNNSAILSALRQNSPAGPVVPQVDFLSKTESTSSSNRNKVIFSILRILGFSALLVAFTLFVFYFLIYRNSTVFSF